MNVLNMAIKRLKHLVSSVQQEDRRTAKVLKASNKSYKKIMEKKNSNPSGGKMLYDEDLLEEAIQDKRVHKNAYAFFILFLESLRNKVPIQGDVYCSSKENSFIELCFYDRHGRMICIEFWPEGIDYWIESTREEGFAFNWDQFVPKVEHINLLID